MRRGDSTGLLLALAGFSLLSLGDAVIKSIGGAWPPTAIALTRYAIGAAMLALLVWRSEGRAGLRFVGSGWQLLRGLGVGMATVGFFAALTVMPLAEATSITFTSPMLTALLAPMLLGERLRAVSFVALLIAFGGVLIVLRPNFTELGVQALWPLLTALGMSLLMIGNRAVAGSGSALAMQLMVACMALPVIGLATAIGHLSGHPAFHLHVADWTVIARCALVAGTATAAHLLIFLGTRRTGASRVAPMTYVQLLVALVLGWAAFGETPDLAALAGAGVIVAAGLLLWWSGREAAEPPAR